MLIIKNWAGSAVCKRYYCRRSNMQDGPSSAHGAGWRGASERASERVAGSLLLPRWVAAMSCEQAALAGLDRSPIRTCVTKAREQVALSCRISPQSSSLHRKLGHPPLHRMQRFNKFVYKEKIHEGTKPGLNIRKARGNHPFICKWKQQSVLPLHGISFKDI